MKNLVKELHEYLADELKKVNDTIISCSNTDEELVGIISNHLINSGGKRIRPMINILSALSFGYKENHHINLAAAVEFIHAATLLHDDVVDESDNEVNIYATIVARYRDSMAENRSKDRKIFRQQQK